MDQNLRYRAAPSCKDCEQPVEHVEFRWVMTYDGDWALNQAFMVCLHGHRVPVKPFEEQSTHDTD